MLTRTVVGRARSGRWLPRRLLLIRHGESAANVNRTLYSHVPDWKIPLTERGRAQAFDCGKRLRNIVKDERLYVYYSPYVRARQTLEEVRKSLLPSQVQGEREDERLREQEMGNFQPIDKMDDTWGERNKFGRAYYRFPDGESSADVGDRLSRFFDVLVREQLELNSLSVRTQLHDCHPDAAGDHIGGLPYDSPCIEEDNVVIVSHGLLIRLFIGRWFCAPVEVFERMRNPPNCGIVVLERSDTGRLVLTSASKSLFGSDPLLDKMRFDGRDNIELYRQMFTEIRGEDDSTGFSPEDNGP
ncbi:putative Histidine phosphatase superfamily (branch 1) [Trypanosoma vivax]|uniref:Putative glycerolphosphate mutase n=1 Tax=Trypanosoma vivax (strain Y486) TaxID=1055687 RepID=G0UAI0_TRYVY|nr:putative Histidine phosphatase superfamily (branch 1) [Trypanosoma vivax]CCC52813.1 putative glycerolphosphate mutase [Trypanosoma vivax Y486]